MDDYNAVLEEVDRAAKEHAQNEMLLADERVAVNAWALILCLMVGLIMILIFAVKAHADDLPERRVVMAEIGEDEQGGERGMLAVACAIQNRGTLNGVYGEHAKRVREHLYSPRTFVLAIEAHNESLNPENCKFIDGAQHWQSKADIEKHPSWVQVCDKTAEVGGNVFYKCP